MKVVFIFLLICFSFATVDFQLGATLTSSLNSSFVAYYFETNFHLISGKEFFVPNYDGLSSDGKVVIDVYQRHNNNEFSHIQTLSLPVEVTSIASVDVSADVLVASDWSRYVAVFVKSTEWEFSQLIDLNGKSPNGTDLYPAAVAVNGNLLVIGCPDYSDILGNDGLVLLYSRPSASSSFSFSSFIFHPSIGPDPDQCGGEYFGVDVVATDEWVFVGATCEVENNSSFSPGAVFIFSRSLDSISYVQTIFSPGPNYESDNEYFGYSVAYAGRHLVVGSPYSNDDVGEVVVFSPIGPADAPWVQTLLLDENSIAFNESNYGASVATIDDVIVIGSPFTDVDSTSEAGLVFVYQYVKGEWSLVQTLEPVRAGVPNGNFGALVDITRDGGEYALLVSAPFTDVVNPAGEVYVFLSRAPDLNGRATSASSILENWF